MKAAAAIAMPSRRLERSPRWASAKATPAIARNSPATGLPSGQRRAKTIASAVAAPLEGEQGGQPERHADRERQPAREEQGGRGHAEPDRAPARALGSEVPARQRLEERGRGERRERERKRRPEQPRDRRRDDAVGGRVMAAVPLAVPDREALLAEQVGPEGVRGKVDGARLPDQVDDREHQRDEQRGERATSRCAGATAAAARSPPGAGSGGCRARPRRSGHEAAP